VTFKVHLIIFMIVISHIDQEQIIIIAFDFKFVFIVLLSFIIISSIEERAKCTILNKEFNC
jgi:uncharacterized membrane protein YjgN (DUF898 family)